MLCMIKNADCQSNQSRKGAPVLADLSLPVLSLVLANAKRSIPAANIAPTPATASASILRVGVEVARRSLDLVFLGRGQFRRLDAKQLPGGVAALVATAEVADAGVAEKRRLRVHEFREDGQVHWLQKL